MVAAKNCKIEIYAKKIKVAETILKTKKRLLQQLHPKENRRLTDENANRDRPLRPEGNT
jgi:flagellar biosynthesis/type III secretory pathway chaperone